MLLEHPLIFSFFISQKKKNPSFMDVQCIYQLATLTLFFFFLAESNLNLK